MNIKVTDEAVAAWAERMYRRGHGRHVFATEWPDVEPGIRTHYTTQARADLDEIAPLLTRFTYTEDDLMQLARGVVPEWLRFDADAALDEELSK